MVRRNGLVWLVVCVALSVLVAGPALAKKSGSSGGGEDDSFNAEEIDRCAIESVNRLSEKTEGLASRWSGLKGKVDGVPGAISTATGEQVATVDEALEQIIALDLPLVVDLAEMKVTVDREGLDEKQTRVAQTLEDLTVELKTVPDAAVEVSEKAVALGTEIADFIPDVAGEFKGNPLQSAVEVPKATKILKGQVDYLKALPDEVRSTVDTVKVFFEGLATAAKDTGADIEEAATTTSSAGEEAAE